MKKLISIILVVMLIFPTTVLSETESDPIIGVWYLYANLTTYPELNTGHYDMDSTLMLFYFLSSGSIMTLTLNTKDGVGTPQYMAAGKWEKNKDTYLISIIGSGTGKGYIKANELVAQIAGENGSYGLLRKMIEFNPYTDIYRK